MKIQWKSDVQSRATAGFPLQRAAQGFDAFAHSLQTVAFWLESAETVVLYGESTDAVIGAQLESAAGGLCMAYDVGDGFADG